MWRGTTRWSPFLAGANLVRAGWLTTGKLVIYPIRRDIDSDGRQLINWVAEIETPQHLDRDWNCAGKLDDFLPAFADWTFDWLDVPALLESADSILEYPMVDQDPLPYWTAERVTLLGDAAHPMVPRGSNGSGQAILDCEALVAHLAAQPDDVPGALAAYEAERRPPTSAILPANRRQPPDAIIGEAVKRTGDKPFRDIDDVISRAELQALSDGDKQISGSSKEALAAR